MIYVRKHCEPRKISCKWHYYETSTCGVFTASMYIVNLLDDILSCWYRLPNELTDHLDNWTFPCLSTNSTHMDWMCFVLLRKVSWNKLPSQIKYLKICSAFYSNKLLITTHHIKLCCYIDHSTLFSCVGPLWLNTGLSWLGNGPSWNGPMLHMTSLCSVVEPNSNI